MQKPPKKKLSTESYKGVRDFYPEDMFLENHIFKVMRDTATSFGYAEYNASVLEPSELYEAKSGEEIVNEQTYRFEDRGGRSVTLRPEMTPTVARMIAARRRELSFPARWFSIPNVFRYERPQRGRLREHWQLNCDIFGVPTIEAEVEIVTLASEIMRAYGATAQDFEIRISSRKLLTTLLNDVLELSDDESLRLSKLIDRKEKMARESFLQEVEALIGEKGEALMRVLESDSLEQFLSINNELRASEGARDVETLLTRLKENNVSNVRFSPTLIRGFDYYTGIVFEVFDTHPDNNRSLFGGGRYDNLLEIFDSEPIPAVGFGMGDVTINDFLDVHGLSPSYSGAARLYLCTLTPDFTRSAEKTAHDLRGQGIPVAVNLLDKKIGDQIKTADKLGIPFVLIIGEEEIASGLYKLKHLGTGEEKTVAQNDIAQALESFIG